MEICEIVFATSINMSLLWKIKRRCLPAFQSTLIGFTLSIVLFILIHPQRTYKMPTVYDQENVDELGQKVRKVGQLSEKVGPNDGNTQDIVKDDEPEKDAINEEEKEMTDEERSKIDEEFKGGDEEKEKNAESKCKYPFPVKRTHILCSILRKLLLKFLLKSI